MARAVLYGIAVSSGIAIGRAFFANRKPGAIRRERIPLTRVEAEAERFENAVIAVEQEFLAAKEQTPEDNPHGQRDILDMHLQICRDPKLRDGTLTRIRKQRMNAEWALEKSMDAIAESFSRIDSPYIRDRIQDVRAVAGRIAGRLAGEAAERGPVPGASDRDILLAYDLTPADALGLSPHGVLAFATEQGGPTSHTGILARGLAIPAVVGAGGLEKDARDGDLLVVDGLTGKVLIAPNDAELEFYERRRARFEEYQREIRRYADAPAETEDGRRIAVLANVETPDEAENVLSAGGEGIGLVRTEFSYLGRTREPGEDDLYEEYARLTRALSPRRVTFRTLDLGADKMDESSARRAEPNPALGMRGIRYCLRHQELFRRQLRAILRAGVHGNAAIMFPLISGVEELRQAKAVLHEAVQELDAEGTRFSRNMPVGIMIELPSAVFVAGELAQEADFFSVGTNDLIQYSLGVDRDNKDVAHLHQPLHPAVIRAVKHVTDMAHKAGIPVCVCGEMAADPYCLSILLGMSVDAVSVAPRSIPGIKHIIRRCNMDESRELLRHALSASTAPAINSMARYAVYSRFPHEMLFFASQVDA